MWNLATMWHVATMCLLSTVLAVGAQDRGMPGLLPPPVVVRGKSISDGYTLPAHKQGYDEQRFMTTLPVNASFLTTRTNAVQALFAPTVRKINLFWCAKKKTLNPFKQSALL